MADSVHLVLERFIPALEDLQEKGIFSPAEIKAVVNKRRDFEYLLKRRAVRKDDYVNYAVYEINLDALRKLRKNKLGIRKTSVSDYSGVQHVHFIFNRALRKFPGDIALWREYAAYARKQDSPKALSKIYARALQLHPRNTGLWIEAASWEFSHNANMNAARILLQRSLRINASSQLLWQQYFRLELMYVHKIRARRQTLGLSLEPLEEEEEEEEEEQEEEQQQQQQQQEEEEEGGDEMGSLNVPSSVSSMSFIEGAVPVAVFNGASDAIPEDAVFHSSFLGICVEFSVNELPAVSGRIIEVLASRFSQSECSWVARAEHAMLMAAGEDGDGTVDSERSGAHQAGIDVFDEAVERLPTSDMWEQYADFVERRIVKDGDSSLLLDLYKRSLSCSAVGARLVPRWVQLLWSMGRLDEALSTAAAASAKFSKDVNVWLLHGGLLSRQLCVGVATAGGDGSDRRRLGKEALEEDAAVKVLRRGIDAVESSKHAAALWRLLLEHLMAVGTVSAVRSTFDGFLHSSSEQPGAVGAVAQQYLTWALANEGLTAARSVCDTLRGFPLSGPAAGRFYKACIRMEQSQLEVDEARVRRLVEKALEVIEDEVEARELWEATLCSTSSSSARMEALSSIEWRVARKKPRLER